MTSINNRRIAKNTIYLYIRTLVVLFVMLYTSRVVLNILGVQDLGIYNVVGGIVTLLSFLQASLSRATSRFLTYELGKNSSLKQLNKVFSISMTIHIIIAAIALILGETIGVYILTNWTTIPLERHFASLIVFQTSLFIFVVHLLRVPYDAILIAHENMSIYAYLSVFEAFLQILLVLILDLVNADKLISYGVLLLLIAIILFIAYWWYIHNNYKYYRFSFLWNKESSIKILTFSGWSLLGSSSNVAAQQGVNLLFNNFVGLLANTALGLTSQVNLAVSKFVTNFMTAFNPQIIKFCAQNDFIQMHKLMNRASKFSFVLIWVMVLPLLTNIDFILKIWLKEVPIYTANFCQIILICSVIDAITGVFNTAITATGKIRNYQICISFSFLLDLACSYCLLKINVNPPIVLSSRILYRGILNMFIGWFYVDKLIKFNILNHIKEVVLPVVITTIVSILGVSIIYFNFQGLDRLLLSLLVSSVLIGFCTFYVIMNREERVSFKAFFKQRLC